MPLVAFERPFVAALCLSRPIAFTSPMSADGPTVQSDFAGRIETMSVSIDQSTHGARRSALGDATLCGWHAFRFFFASALGFSLSF